MSRSHELRFRYAYLYKVYYRCIYRNIYNYIYICRNMYICIQIYLHTYSYIYIQKLIYIFIFKYTYRKNINIYIPKYIKVNMPHMYPNFRCKSWSPWGLLVKGFLKQCYTPARFQYLWNRWSSSFKYNWTYFISKRCNETRPALVESYTYNPQVRSHSLPGLHTESSSTYKQPGLS